MNDERRLLESILTTQIVLLAEDLRRRDKAGGRKRVGADYIRKAAKVVRRKQPKVLRALGLPPAGEMDPRASVATAAKARFGEETDLRGLPRAEWVGARSDVAAAIKAAQAKFGESLGEMVLQMTTEADWRQRMIDSGLLKPIVVEAHDADAAYAKAEIGGATHDDTLEPPKPKPEPEPPDEDERRTD